MFLFCLIINLLDQVVWAQTISNLNSSSPPSFQSMSIGDLSKISNRVDMYTGRLNYGISLMDVPMAGMSIPLGVNYSTTGFRVQEVPGVNGLGWGNSLNAMITRSVQDLPDEFFYGYCGQNKTGTQNYIAYNQDFFNKTTKLEWDSQPDKFYFSFFGFSGSFVLDSDGRPVMQSNSSGIQVVTCPYVRVNGSMGNKWVLRDQQGNQYIFGQGGGTFTIDYLHGEKENKYESYSSGWHLDKIIRPSGKEINFKYNTHASVTNITYVNMKRIIDGLGSCSGNTASSWNENTESTISSTYLTKISCDQTVIDLEYNHNRLDVINGKALTAIRVSQNGNETVCYQFGYGYFTSSEGTHTKRLKLQSINENHLGAMNRTLYSFSYNELVNLPARNSLQTDYWGYYNQNATGNNLIGEADKTPSYTNTKANVLECVTNALGGSTFFEYQLNSYSQNNQTFDIGGLRLSRTYEKNANGDPKQYRKATYTYNLPNSSLSSGQKFSTYGSDYSFQVDWYCSKGGQVETYRSSEPLDALYDTNGSPVGYSYVTVQGADNSSSRFHFTNYSDYPDEFEHGYSNYNTNTVTYVSSTYPGLPTTSMGFARGQILSEELLDNAGNAVKTTQYYYNLGPRTGNVVGTKAVLWAYWQDSQWNQYKFSRFKYFTQDLKLINKVEKYRKGSVDQQISSETYFYTDYAPNLIRSVYRSDGGERMDKYMYRYPFDVIPYLPNTMPSLNRPMTFMTYNNMISSPVEVIHSAIRDEVSKVLDVQITKYSSVPNLNTVLPYMVAKLESSSPILESGYTPYSVYYDDGSESEIIDNRVNPILVYGNYDFNGNPQETHSFTSQTAYRSSLYGYEGLYKVADINNAQLNDVAYSSFEHNDKGNWSYSGSRVFDINSITGKNCYNIAKGAISKTGLKTGTVYLLTYWTKNSVPYNVSGTQGSAIQLSSRNGWQNYQHKITGVTSVSIAGSSLVDEVRLYPAGANMTTYTYEPLVGISSQTDENNSTAYSSYDEYNRLQFVRDGKKNIVQANGYNFNGDQAGHFNTFSNSAKSGTFVKNDCGAGFAGSAVTYTVEAGRYAASTQLAADALAQRDIDLNGQNYANTNGTCTTQVIYARVEISGYSTENYYSDAENYGSTTKGDVYIRLYSDAACTTPLTLTAGMTVIIAEGYEFISSWSSGNSRSNNSSFTIPAGSSSYFVGRNIIEQNQTLTNPYSGYGTETENMYYSFTMQPNGNYYVALPTKE